jgi:hypothetical protein
LQIGPDEFRIGLHLTKHATQRAAQFFLVREVSVMSLCSARVSPQFARSDSAQVSRVAVDELPASGDWKSPIHLDGHHNGNLRFSCQRPVLRIGDADDGHAALRTLASKLTISTLRPLREITMIAESGGTVANCSNSELDKPQPALIKG